MAFKIQMQKSLDHLDTASFRKHVQMNYRAWKSFGVKGSTYPWSNKGTGDVGELQSSGIKMWSSSIKRVLYRHALKGFHTMKEALL